MISFLSTVAEHTKPTWEDLLANIVRLVDATNTWTMTDAELPSCDKWFEPACTTTCGWCVLRVLAGLSPDDDNPEFRQAMLTIQEGRDPTNNLLTHILADITPEGAVTRRNNHTLWDALKVINSPPGRLCEIRKLVPGESYLGKLLTHVGPDVPRWGITTVDEMDEGRCHYFPRDKNCTAEDWRVRPLHALSE